MAGHSESDRQDIIFEVGSRQITIGQVERMNRTFKDATVKRFHYDDHDHLRIHLAACNFARRLKTLGGLTPYEYICKNWTSEPDNPR